jgi:hypothetical protein
MTHPVHMTASPALRAGHGVTVGAIGDVFRLRQDFGGPGGQRSPADAFSEGGSAENALAVCGKTVEV